MIPMTEAQQRYHEAEQVLTWIYSYEGMMIPPSRWALILRYAVLHAKDVLERARLAVVAESQAALNKANGACAFKDRDCEVPREPEPDTSPIIEEVYGSAWRRLADREK
jgi:hypothetical protein